MHMSFYTSLKIQSRIVSVWGTALVNTQTIGYQHWVLSSAQSVAAEETITKDQEVPTRPK